MKRAQKLQTLIFSIVYVFSFSLFNTGLAYADTKPYFKAYGADTFSGGWFNAYAVACDPGGPYYQAPVLSGTTNYYKGGVMAFADVESGRKGASSEFAAISLGLIEGANANKYGFYSHPSSGYKDLCFSNFTSLTVNSYWGGILAGSAPQAHCAPDYFSTKQNSSTIDKSINSASVDVATLASKQYLINPSGILNINAG